MYTIQNQIKRLRNMGSEWLRITQLMFGRSKTSYPEDNWFFHGLRSQWEFNDYHKTSVFGRPYGKPVLVRDPSWPKHYCQPLKDSNGKFVYRQRDLFDQVIDTISHVVLFYWRNVFIQEACTHPHDRVYIEWEGYREYGFYKNHLCEKCGGYIGDPESQVDRYLPENQRRPDLIKGDPTNPQDRQDCLSKYSYIEEDDYPYVNED